MELVTCLEHRYERTPDGSVWTTVTCPYSFWQRYLEVFDRVRVIARIRDVASVSPDCQRADGEGVSFVAVPYYVGPAQYLLRSQQVKQVAQKAVTANDAVILRIGSQVATLIEPLLRKRGHPYGVEVVSDPYDVFAPGANNHPLRPLFRHWFPHTQKRQCAGASAAAYVTKYALQQRYPCPNFSVGISDVELTKEAFVSKPRPFTEEARTLNLIYLGTMAQLYKAPDVLIKAFAACVQEGLDIKLTLIGDGKHRAELEALATNLDLKERICFLGQLPAGHAVRDRLDLADLFVLPSHQEGLPRAMVEAMARALPVIGSTVGGIPELLPPEDMVLAGDVNALARKIRSVVTDPRRMARMSERNLEKAKEYKDEILREQRIAFYRYVKQTTETFLTQKTAIAGRAFA